ncbi:hypothetical protein ACHAXS_000653 [Conticribra weissflogii]
MLLLEKMEKSVRRCLKVSSSTVQVENSRLFVSRKLFMVCIKVLVLSGNISNRNFAPMACLKLLLIPASLLGKVIAICYVDDLIFWARNEKDIIELAIQLHTGGDLEQEHDSVGFLGVHIKCNPNTRFLNMTQKGLIKQVLEILCLNVGTANGKFTPAKGKPPAKHAHGGSVSSNFNYSSVVGMLLYLAGHTCPDITHAVICAARYMFYPKLVHKHALKEIGVDYETFKKTLED